MRKMKGIYIKVTGTQVSPKIMVLLKLIMYLILTAREGWRGVRRRAEAH